MEGHDLVDLSRQDLAFHGLSGIEHPKHSNERHGMKGM